MEYKIIVDSCGELTGEMKKDEHFQTVSLAMEVSGKHIIDDENFDQKEFLRLVAESEECPKSSCPSPEEYMNSYKDGDRVYIVTLSAELSGSYNSAELGRNLYYEEVGEKDIHVFNSKTASVGQTLIALKIKECEDMGMSFDEVVSTVEAYIDEQKTYFVLDNIDTLKKNGRLTGLKALVATALNIKPVLCSTPEGTIDQLGKARGVKKAVSKMIELIVSEQKDTKDKVLGIANCNCPERAKSVKEHLMETNEFKDVVIVDTAGISTMYANDGGVIVVL